MKKYQVKLSELQKGAGYSPFGGCLPLLIILPIFAGLFGAVSIMQKEQTAQVLVNISNGVLNPQQLMTSFGWIRNIWAPDSMLLTSLPSMVDINNVAAFVGPSHLTPDVLVSAKAIASSLSGNEAALQQFLYSVGAESTWGITGTLTLAKASNGLFVLPVIGGLAAFFSQKISMKNMPTTSDQSNQTMKMMLYMMPLITVFIGATSSSAFSFYWITSMVFSFFEQLIFQAYFKKKRQKEEELEVVTISGGKE